MTVVLAGVGADTTNLGALGRLTADGRFDYVPIPEKTPETTETTTLGSWPLRTTDGVAADLTTRITPQPARNPGTTTATVADWPVHHDPNLEHLTYGEHRSQYIERLARLEPGDAVAFYAGLRCPDGRAHRYVIGHMTVHRVEVLEPSMSPEDTRRLLERHSHNAHAKRAREGRPFLAEKRIVIVDGTTPGGLLERNPPRLSEYTSGGYRLEESVADRLGIVEDRRHLGFKPALTSPLTPASFLDWLINT